MRETYGLSTVAEQIRSEPVTVEKVKSQIPWNSSGPGISAATRRPDDSNAVRYPRCDAAMRNMEAGEWQLADAIVEECSETGESGVKNESYAKMEAMRAEIARNHGIDLSLERIRKLRKVASAFPAGRRRPAVSLESHLEAGTPEALDTFIKSANGAALTRQLIRSLKHPVEDGMQARQKDERRHQVEDHRKALQGLCRQLEQEKEEREQRYAELCREMGKEPQPFSAPLVPEDGPTLTVGEELERSIRALLLSRGFDPADDNTKRAIDEFVKAILAQ